MLLHRHFKQNIRVRNRKSLPPCSLFLFMALPWSFLVNGKASPTPPIEQNGEVYIPLSALKAAGAQVSREGHEVRIQFLPYQNGANQIEGVEGPVSTWLNNGLWRFRVLKVEPATDPFDPQKPGYNVTLEIRNASAKAISPFQTGVEFPQLFDSGEAVLKVDEGAWQTRLQMKEMLRGGGMTATIPFYYPHGTPTVEVKPALKLVLPINTSSGLLRDTGLKYAVKSPALRVWLKPQNEGTAE